MKLFSEMIWRSFIILVFTLCVSHHVVAQSNSQLIPVTYSSSDEKKEAPRIQINSQNGVYKMEGFYFPSLPSNFRSIRSKSPRLKLNRNSIVDAVTTSLDETYHLNSDSRIILNTGRPTEVIFKKQKNRFLHGENAQPYFRHQWVMLGKLNAVVANDFSFRVKRFLKKPLTYSVDFLPSSLAWRFPAIDPRNCVTPQLGFFELKKLQGYGIDKIRSTRYKTEERITRRKNFEIYFKQNETNPDKASVAEIIDYLKQNDFVIMKAEMQGAASIEGSVEGNKRLQKERASVIQKIFREYNDNPVNEDTIVLIDNFGPFRQQIKNSSFAWLDTLVNEAMQHRINTDPHLLVNLEPLLRTQRKATLKLTMAKKLSFENQMDQLTQTIERLMNSLVKNRPAQPDVEATVMGAIDQLMEFYIKGRLSQQRVEVILNSSPNAEYLNVLTGYYFLKRFSQHEKKNQIPQWKEEWKRLNINHWLNKANENAMALAESTVDRGLKSKYLRMCVDFQWYRFQFAVMKMIDANELCAEAFPSDLMFTGLRLNQYAFLYELSNEQQINCFVNNSISKSRKDSLVNTDKVINEIHDELELNREVLTGNDKIYKPSFNTQPKGAYYELLKSYYVKGDKQVMDWVQFANGDKPELNVFNLLHLLQITVNEFKPMQNYFYDEEITLKELDKLIIQMKRIDQSLCPPEINQLYLDYHLKSLYYLQKYFEPGDEQLTRIAENSLRYMTDYYKKRATQVNTNLSTHVTWQLNQFNELPGTKPGAWYGFDLLNTIASKRKLEGEELKLYAHYLKMYNADFKPTLPKFYNKDEIVTLGEEWFR